MTKFRLLAVLSLITLCSASLAVAQDGRWGRGRDNDGYYGRDSQNSNRAYQQGYRDGQQDRARNSTPKIRNGGWSGGDRDSYIAGYRAGYGSYNNGGGGGWGNGRNDRDRDGDWRNDRNPDGRNGRNGDWGYGNRGVAGNAYRIGYEDGLRHGAQDRQTGHSFRPTQHDDYKDGDRGYSSGYGSKQAYKDTYRNGFRSGYDRGWNSRGGYGSRGY